MFRRFRLHKAIGDKGLLLILPKPPLCPRLLLGTFVGNVNNREDRSSRSCPVRSLGARLSVAGGSQRERVCTQPHPAGGAWGVGRGAWGGRRENSGQSG